MLSVLLVSKMHYGILRRSVTYTQHLLTLHSRSHILDKENNELCSFSNSLYEYGITSNWLTKINCGLF